MTLHHLHRPVLVVDNVRPIPQSHHRLIEPEFDHYSSADPDQMYADALLDEIGEGVVWLAWGAIAALFVVLWCVS